MCMGRRAWGKQTIRNERQTVKKILSLALLTAAVATTQAQIISWNVDVYGGIGSGEHAGVVDAYNWNNTWAIHYNGTGASVANPNLMDNSGAATTLDIYQLASQNGWNYYSIQGSTPGLDLNGSSNKRLLNGYNNKGGSEDPFLSRISLDQIPYAQYNLFVYFSSDAAGRNGSVTDGTTSFYFSTIGAPSISGDNALLTLTTEADSANHPAANYALFSGLTGASKTIEVSIPDWGGIAGIQIQAVPEPSSLALMLGVFGGLALRRRR
jgi:hypothetical protein